jgi:Mrp family chromosome partitioning ATPase
VCCFEGVFFNQGTVETGVALGPGRLRWVSVGVSGEAQAVNEPGWDRGPGLVSALWRYRWVVLIVACLSAVAGFVYRAVQPAEFEAAGRVVLASPYERTLFRHELGVPFVDVDRYINMQAEQMTSPDVLAGASELLTGRLTPGQIRPHVTAEGSMTVLEITVRARFNDPAEAANVVNAVLQAYEGLSARQANAKVEAAVAQLAELEAELRERLEALDEDDASRATEAERNGLSEELADLQTKAGQIRTDAAVYGTGVDRIEPAVPPEQPVSDSPRRTAVIFGLLGFIAALIGAFWRVERVRVVDRSADAAGVVNAPLLGELSSHQARTAPGAAPVVTAPDSAAAREHQFIASRVALLGRESEPQVVLVTSPGKTSGRSVTALNLGLAAALDQRSVVLVDVDPAGWLTGLLNADRQPGVSDLIGRGADGDVIVSNYVAIVDELSEVDGFRFIPVGMAARDGGQTTGAPQMAKLLARLLQESNLVILDGAPLLRVPGASRLAADVDAAILVIARGTKLDDLRQTVGLLGMADTPIIGYVFDQSRPPSRWRSGNTGEPALPRHRPTG